MTIKRKRRLEKMNFLSKERRIEPMTQDDKSSEKGIKAVPLPEEAVRMLTKWNEP